MSPLELGTLAAVVTSAVVMIVLERVKPYNPGQPLLRRPKHSATTTLSYLGRRWGASLGGSFVDRRSDSDFFGFGIDHAAGYVRADFGGWYEGGVLAAALLFLWQQWPIRKREPAGCLRAFLNNQYVGLAVFVGILLEYVYA